MSICAACGHNSVFHFGTCQYPVEFADKDEHGLAVVTGRCMCPFSRVDPEFHAQTPKREGEEEWVT